MKQTAVEWQFEQFFNSFEKFNNGECTFNDYLKRNLEIRDQAKEMEKQQQDYSEKQVLELIQFLAEKEYFKEHSSMSIFIAKDYLNQFKNK